MRLGPEELLELLIGASPVLAGLARRHRSARHGTICAEDLVTDLRRYCLRRFDQGDQAAVDRCLEVFDRAIAEGDPGVQHAVGVAFVEASGPWEPESQAFVATWPPRLRADARGYQIARDSEA